MCNVADTTKHKIIFTERITFLFNMFFIFNYNLECLYFYTNTRGWINYFRIADMKGSLIDITSHLNRRIRCIIYKQWKHGDIDLIV